ncbi:hypothetical protein VTO42DRAFT_8593 [Malbranchea cinnamomea]
MAQSALWSSLLTAVDPFNAKALPAALQSTIDFLETELAKARAALEELQSQPTASATLLSGDVPASRAVAACEVRSPGCITSPPGNKILHRPLQLTAPPNTKYMARPKPKPNPLLRVLSNSLVLDHLAPYLSVSSLLSLASTSREFRFLIMGTPYVFRYLDLRRCRGAQIDSVVPIDSGGQVWRSERMDESLTEDDFYSGPLRGIFSNLERRSVLQDVRTLILDGLAVPTDLITEIITSERFQVSILSIRECRHLNERKLMQSLQYAVRPNRAKGMPRVKGIYFFGAKDSVKPTCKSKSCGCIPNGDATQETSQGNKAPAMCCSQSFSGRRWYEPSGRVLLGPYMNGWAETLQMCQRIIAFDAVLCRSPRHDPSLYSPDNPRVPDDPFLLPSIATVAVGPSGCASCGTIPEGPTIWGQSPDECFPLLAPPPLHSSRVSAAKCPSIYPNEQPTLVVRCDQCIANRRCHRCRRWWCSTCVPQSASTSSKVKITRDCWECGPTCNDCKKEVQRTCISCFGEYCIQHNDGCSPTKCDWCCNTRQTQEMY